MNIGIIGGGSIGLLLAGYLSEKHAVTLYVNRKQQEDALLNNKLRVLKSSALYREVSVPAKQLKDAGREDVFIVCVKQPHIEQVVQLLRRLDFDVPLLFLQNGMGHLEKIKQLSQSTYVGIIEHGASRENDSCVNHLGTGKIKLAACTGTSSELSMLIQQLHQDTFPFESTDDWEALLKEKLIINAAINPLTALFDIPNGTIASNEHIRLLAESLCKEAADALDLDSETAFQRVLETARNTKENTSSMRADILAGQKTENEAISGYILQCQGMEKAPYTAFVYRSILALEKKGQSVYDSSVL